MVRCEFDDDGTGWLLVLRRLSDMMPFARTQYGYKRGFGDLSMTGEYWWGNEAMYLLTNGPRTYELRVDLIDTNSRFAYVRYASFLIENELQSYTLRLGEYFGGEGGADEALSFYNGQPFGPKHSGEPSYMWWFRPTILYDDCWLTGIYPTYVRWPYSGIGRGHNYAAMKLRPAENVS
ncbi:ficolin-2-like [Glandiceps talaboti]